MGMGVSSGQFFEGEFFVLKITGGEPKITGTFQGDGDYKDSVIVTSFDIPTGDPNAASEPEQSGENEREADPINLSIKAPTNQKGLDAIRDLGKSISARYPNYPDVELASVTLLAGKYVSKQSVKLKNVKFYRDNNMPESDFVVHYSSGKVERFVITHEGKREGTHESYNIRCTIPPKGSSD